MKQLLYKGICAVIGLGIGLSVATRAEAFFFFGFDVMRTGQFALQGVQRLLEIVTEYEKIYTKKQELAMRTDRTGISEADLPQGYIYAYMKENDVMKMGSEKYLPATGVATADMNTIRQRLFFPADESQITQEQKDAIVARRYAYVEALAKEVLSLSSAIKDQAAREQERLAAAQTTGSGVQQIELLAQNRKVMVEQEAASVLLQAKLFELEAAQMLLNMSPQLIKEPKPEEGEAQ